MMTVVHSSINRFLPFALLLGAVAVAGAPAHAQETKGSQAALVAALSKSKLTLADGIRQAAKSGSAPISAKFEFDDAGKLSLSIYTAQKGLAVAPEKNVLQELSGSPEQSNWKPEVEVFKDVPHAARAATQLTLMSLSRTQLLDLVAQAEKRHGGKVLSATPEIRQGKPVVAIELVRDGKSTETYYPLLSDK